MSSNSNESGIYINLWNSNYNFNQINKEYLDNKIYIKNCKEMASDYLKGGSISLKV